MNKLQLMMAAQAKAKAEAKAEAETLAKEKTIAKEKAKAEKAEKAELIKGIKAFHKSLLKGLKAEAKAKAKELIKSMKNTIIKLEAEAKAKTEEAIEEAILRTGSWASIYNALDGTTKGLAKATPDLLRNIRGWVEANAKTHLIIKFNSKFEFNFNNLKGKGEDIAMVVIYWLYRQEYLNSQCIYHTDFKFDDDNNLLFNPYFKELGIYKFATIVAKGIKKYIVKNYINKYNAFAGKSGHYVDVMDVVAKEGAEDIANQDSEEINKVKKQTLLIEASEITNSEIIEFVNEKGEFKFNLFANTIEQEKGDELSPEDRYFLESLTLGLNSRNLEKFNITSHKYKLTRNKLVRKGFLQANVNLLEEINKYKNIKK